MAKWSIDSDTLTAIANAVRTKRGTSALIPVSELADEILLINGGRPIVPQTGTWQFKTTTPYKYVILGTDDSTSSDPYFYRLCRSYGFPYTCNVIPDYMDRTMRTDDVEGFTEDDAPALFTTAPTTRQFLTACKDRTDIEFALHGNSSKHLVDSSKLTDELWTAYYTAYTTEGGTKTLAEFKEAFLDSIADYDLAQDAPYIERSRSEIEEVIGKYVDTCGIWGGTGTTTIDEIELSISEIANTDYDWRGNGYTALGYYLVSQFNPSRADKVNTDYIRMLQRNSEGVGDFLQNYNLMKVGDCIELFHHFTDSVDIETHKQQLATIKQYVDANKVRVVTRKQYAELGEYVNNPVTSIDVTRTASTISIGDVDSKSEYTVIATFADDTTEDVTNDAIVEFITDTSEAKLVNVPAYYKGFTDTVQVEVQGSSSNIIEATVLNDRKMNNTDGTIGIGYGSHVYRYDVAGLTHIYFISTKNKQYLVGWSESPIDEGAVSDFSKPYYNPSNNATEIEVPQGMKYYYCHSTRNEDIDYPWTISKVDIN